MQTWCCLNLVKYYALVLLLLQGQAAAGVVFVACHPTAASVSGLYFSSFEPAVPSLEARNPDAAAALWGLSERLIAEKTANQWGRICSYRCTDCLIPYKCHAILYNRTSCTIFVFRVYCSLAQRSLFMFTATKGHCLQSLRVKVTVCTVMLCVEVTVCRSHILCSLLPIWSDTSWQWHWSDCTSSNGQSDIYIICNVQFLKINTVTLL